jgi:energy-coupling factor transporter ATP-binding protein EcfA2
MPLVSIREVSFRYRGARAWALADVSLDVAPGDFVIVTGPSGCGKTTLARCINGLIPHFYEGEYRGEVIVDGNRVSETEPHELSPIVGYVFQNPDNQIIMTTVERDLAFGLENLGLKREEIKERIEWAADVVGIRELLKRRPSELSTGQRQRVAIAGIIAMRPKILIVDEPTAYISPSTSAKLLAFIHTELNRKLGMTIILIEHKLELAARYASKIVVMDRGRIIAAGPPREVLVRDDVARVGIGIPLSCRVYLELKKAGVALPTVPLSPEELKRVIQES